MSNKTETLFCSIKAIFEFFSENDPPLTFFTNNYMFFEYLSIRIVDVQSGTYGFDGSSVAMNVLENALVFN